MHSLESIQTALATFKPAYLDLPNLPRAAVALIVRGGVDGSEVLLIERAKHELDPWSGQLAFPGGRVEKHDVSSRAAAQRESLEEVGLDISASHFLGQLDDTRGRNGELVVGCFIYYVVQPATLTPNHEVARAFWVPLKHLVDETKWVKFRYTPMPDKRFPAVQLESHGSHVLWGLTYRFISQFLFQFGYQLPQEITSS